MAISSRNNSKHGNPGAAYQFLAVGDTFAPMMPKGALKRGGIVNLIRNSDGADVHVRVEDVLRFNSEPSSVEAVSAFDRNVGIWATPVIAKGKRFASDHRYSFVFEGVQGYLYGEKWRLRSVSNENPVGKATIPQLRERVRTTGKLAGDAFYGKTVDPRVVDREWKRACVIHGISHLGAPVQRAMREEFETAFWRGAARGFAANPVPPVTDRALRYRANANPPPGPKRCLFCGSKDNVEVGHLDGHEENNKPANLVWNCRSCNTTLGIAFKKLGLGRRTRQYNPAPSEGAQSVGQWVQALQALRGEPGAVMEPAAALEMVHATPADRRSDFSREIWRKRRARYGSTGRRNPVNPVNAARAEQRASSQNPLSFYQSAAEADALSAYLRKAGYSSKVIRPDKRGQSYVVETDAGQDTIAVAAAILGHGTFRKPGALEMMSRQFPEVYRRLTGVFASSLPNPEGPAADLYEKFHGKPSERIDVVEETVHYHENLAALGQLVELKIKTPTKIRATLRFPEDGPDVPTLAASEDGRQLFIIGGDQVVNLGDIDMAGAQWKRDTMDLGELIEITCHTVKGFHKFEPTNYFHKLGE